MQRLVALVGEVEGGRISLAPLRMEHPLLGTTALQQQVYSHYLRAALPELVKLVGSANVLGETLKLTLQPACANDMGWLATATEVAAPALRSSLRGLAMCYAGWVQVTR
jgi:hypothetical protein